MKIQDRLKRKKELKNLLAELKTIQAKNKLRYAQLETLQERAEKMLIEIDATKGEI
jgi:hypothetical protein